MKTFVLVSMFFTSIAWAGPSSSGGGFAVVCRDFNNQIQSAELLDLYEARTVHHFSIMEPSGSEISDYMRAVRNGYRLQGYSPMSSEAEMERNVMSFMQIVEFLPSDEKLPNLGDLGKVVLVPQGCAIEPLAVFYDSQNIVTMDRQIWDSLNSLNRAALIIHELYYHFLRQLRIYPDTNSLEARTMTASSFALNLIPAMSGIPTNLSPHLYFHNCENVGENKTSCTEPTSFYRLPRGNDGNGKPLFRLQFTHLAGRPMKSLTTIDIPQFINYGDVYQVQSKELLGWTAEVARDESLVGTTAVKLLIKRGSELMVELVF